MEKLIGIMGPAGCGKSTLGAWLSNNYGFIRKPFSAPIKGMLTNFLHNQGLDHDVIVRMLAGDLKEEPTEYFCGRSPRYAMQTLGTEWRDLIHKHLWIDAWERDVRQDQQLGRCSIVVEDVRFIHEVERIRSLGGSIIEVRRLGYLPNENHPSESEFTKIHPDWIVHNTMNTELMFNETLLWINQNSK